MTNEEEMKKTIDALIEQMKSLTQLLEISTVHIGYLTEIIKKGNGNG